MKIKSFRNIINLSLYLDGDLSPSKKVKVEEEINKDQQSQEILNLMQQVKFLLKSTPKRKIPKNFLLTPEMVGMKPPVPHSVPIFRMASVAAALVFVFSFAITNVYPSLIAPKLSSNTLMAQGMGGGGGGCGYDDPADCPPQVEGAQAFGVGGGAPETEVPMAAATAPSIDNSTESIPEETPDGSNLRMTEPVPDEGIQPKIGSENLPRQLFELNSIQLVSIGVSVFLILIVIIIRQYGTFKWRKRL